MAHLVKPVVVSYMLNGKRVPSGTPGAKKVTKKAKKWYGASIPGMGTARVPLASNKTVAQKMLVELVEQAERGDVGLPARADAQKKTMSELLEDFLTSRALVDSKRSRPAGEQQLKKLRGRIGTVLEACNVKRPADLTAEKVQAHLAQRLAIPERKGGGIGPQTHNHIVTSITAFAKWLVKKRYLRTNPLADLGKVEIATDIRHARQPLGAADLQRLLTATRESKRTYKGLTGEDRYVLSLVAIATGFRVMELASLTPASFNLDAEPPLVRLPAKKTKSKRPVRQVLPAALVPLLRSYLAGKDTSAPVWPGTWCERAAEMRKRDLEEAGLTYAVETEDGTLYRDFHSQRHQFATLLDAVDASPKEKQTLARHTDVRLTLNRYTHTNDVALARVVDQMALPGLTAPVELTRDQVERLALLGWAVVACLFALPLAQLLGTGGDNAGQPGTEGGAN